MNKLVLIVAGGSGVRMKSEIPKQFLLIHNQPVLMHCINRFYEFDNNPEIRVVLPQLQIDSWKTLCKKYNFTLPHTIYPGGDTRFQSVKNGLVNIPDKTLVAIHDGVRPLVSHGTLERCFNEAEKNGAVVPVIGLNDSIRKMSGEYSTAEDRFLYRLVQTPQVFTSEILRKAYASEYKEMFTDDASVVEAAGFKVFLARGNSENIKITSPNDIFLAEALLNANTI